MTTRSLAILLWSADPTRPEMCATPFSLASAAAAMDATVEVYFSARSVLLLQASTAFSLFAAPPEFRARRSVGQFMEDAHAQGARFFACQASLAACSLQAADCGPWLGGLTGATVVADRALDPSWQLLVF
jgi:hypothetical protein